MRALSNATVSAAVLFTGMLVFSVLGAALVPIVSTSFGLAAVVRVGAAACVAAIPAFLGVLRPLDSSLGAATERPVPA